MFGLLMVTEAVEVSGVLGIRGLLNELARQKQQRRKKPEHAFMVDNILVVERKLRSAEGRAFQVVLPSGSSDPLRASFWDLVYGASLGVSSGIEPQATKADQVLATFVELDLRSTGISPADKIVIPGSARRLRTRGIFAYQDEMFPLQVDTDSFDELQGVELGEPLRRSPVGWFPVEVYGRKMTQPPPMLAFFQELLREKGQIKTVEKFLEKLNTTYKDAPRRRFTKGELIGYFFMFQARYEPNRENPQFFKEDQSGLGFFPRTEE